MLNSVDTAAFYFINKTCANPGLDVIMSFITRAGSGAILVLLSIALFFSARKERVMSGILLLAGLTLTYQVVTVLKDLVARPRPFMCLSGVRLLSGADGYSFPSNHAAAVFMAAVILSSV
ncbi:MAG: phosphatase PAP2 family protein, partial [Candidatus Omnitrophica bacterium]|nr:phosphatase PAP2 family protein [Candidatus Omnitrophota bacterium]